MTEADSSFLPLKVRRVAVACISSATERLPITVFHL
jgi:hypothetical protein